MSESGDKGRPKFKPIIERTPSGRDDGMRALPPFQIVPRSKSHRLEVLGPRPLSAEEQSLSADLERPITIDFTKPIDTGSLPPVASDPPGGGSGSLPSISIDLDAPPASGVVDTRANSLLGAPGEPAPAKIALEEVITQLHPSVLFGIAPEPAAPAGQVPDALSTAPPGPPVRGPLTSLPAPAPIDPRAAGGDPAFWKGNPPSLPPMTPFPNPLKEHGFGHTLATRAPLVAMLLRAMPLMIAAGLTFGFLYLFIIRHPSADGVQSASRTRAEVNRAMAEAARSKNREEAAKLKAPIANEAVPSDHQQAAAAIVPPAAAPAPAPAAPHVVADLTNRIRISTEPSDAEVQLDGMVLGRTPLVAAKPSAGDKLRFRLSRAKYVTWEGEIVPDPKLPGQIKLVWNNGKAASQELACDASGQFRLNVRLKPD